MGNSMSIKRPLAIGVTAVALFALAVASALILWGPVSGSATPAEWPALSMKYQVSGKFYAVGDTEPDTVTKEILVEYRGINDWKRSVVTAPTITDGTLQFSETGSYTEVKDGVMTDYDATGGGTSAETLTEDQLIAPELRLYPLPFDAIEQRYDGEPVQRSVDVTVCFDDQCETSVQGWVFTEDEEEYIYVDDARGIPIALPGMTITEVRVTGARQPVDRD
ncbi:MAG: hypothetical protein F4X65_13840 [Chloroflexi bacterium]|nr:hypothetical protein [Chloroflexota bacterium]